MEVLRLLKLCFVEIILNLIIVGSASKVPVFFWGKHCEPDLLPPVSALSSLSTNDFEGKYLNYFTTHKTLIAFIQDELSLEDVTKKPSPFPNLELHLRKEPSVILSSVENPVTALENLTSTIVRSADLDERSLERILDEEKPKILLVQLPSTANALDRREILRANDAIMERLQKMFLGDESLNFALTATSPSWNSKEEAESHVRMARHLQQAADVSNQTDNFVNVSSLLYLYAESVSLLPNGTDSNITYLMPPIIKLQNYSNSTSSNKSMLVEFEFSRTSNPADKMNLMLLIETQGGKWWYVSRGELQENHEPTSTLLTSDVGASMGFSYSCGTTVWTSTSNSSKTSIQFGRFQMEFLPKRQRFSESFSCATYFTIPMWMGLFVILLFTAILASGIYLLFEVKTMDRFDDPKGKSITVPQTD